MVPCCYQPWGIASFLADFLNLYLQFVNSPFFQLSISTPFDLVILSCWEPQMNHLSPVRKES